MQTSPDKIPSFIPLQADDKPASRVAQPFDEISFTIEHPDKPKPRDVSEDTPSSLVNGKLEHETDGQQPSKKTPLSEFNVTIPLTEGGSPVKGVQKPLESVR